MNNKNLVSLADRPEAERKEIASKGGKASGEAKRRAKAFKQALEEVVYSGVHDENFLNNVEDFPFKQQPDLLIDYTPTNALEAIAMNIVYRAIDGNPFDIRTVRETIIPKENE